MPFPISSCASRFQHDGAQQEFFPINQTQSLLYKITFPVATYARTFNLWPITKIFIYLITHTQVEIINPFSIFLAADIYTDISTQKSSENASLA